MKSLLIALVLCVAVTQCANYYITVYDNYFDPAVLSIRRGDWVSWIWAQNVSNAHSVRNTTADSCQPVENGWTTGAPTNSSSFVFSYRFDYNGSYTYMDEAYCGVGMSGIIRVSMNSASGLIISWSGMILCLLALLIFSSF